MKKMKIKHFLKDYEKEYQKCQQLLMFLYQTKGDLEN